jgi:hypothetical protein
LSWPFPGQFGGSSATAQTGRPEPEPDLYGEGEWLTVPLTKGGVAAGVIARKEPRRMGILLCYPIRPFDGPEVTLEQLRWLSAAR